MNHYVFYTSEGFSQTPLGEDIENMQILGFAEGVSAEKAMKNLFYDNPWIEKSGYSQNKIICRTLA